MKTTPEELRQFYADKTVWTEDAWYDEAEFFANGISLDESQAPEDQPDGTVITIASGVFMGSGEPRELTSVLRAWRKNQTHEFVTVCVPKGAGVAVRSFAKTL